MPDCASQYTQTPLNVYQTRPSPVAHVVRFGALIEFVRALSSETSLQTQYRSTFIEHNLDIFV